MTSIQEMMFRVLEKCDVPACATLLSRNFVSKESLTKFQSITHEEFMCFATPLCEQGVGTSIVGYDKDTLEIQSCLVSIVESRLVGSPVSPKFNLIFNVLDQLNATCPNVEYIHSFNKESLLHFYLAGVDDIHAGKGYTHSMILENLILARMLGIKLAIVEATVAPSMKSFLKAGFTIQHVLRYSTFQCEGLDGENEGESAVDNERGGQVSRVRICPLAGLEGEATLLTKEL